MQKISVLFVDDEALTLSALERYLRRTPYVRHYAANGLKALALMDTVAVDIVVTDMKMPEMDGIDLLKQVKTRYPFTVRLALSAYAQADRLLPCINTGEIFRFVNKPIDPPALRQALRDAADYFRMRKEGVALLRELQEKNDALRQSLERQKQVEAQLRHIAVIDALTGLYNRRYLTMTLAHEYEQCRRYGQDLGCLMMDLDHFKRINDTYGHAFGDFVIREFAARLKRVVRAADMVFRYGGEEFLALLPRTELDQASAIAARLLETCRSEPFDDGRNAVTVTTSIGVVSYVHGRPSSPDDLVAMADGALYEAKKAGRNRVVC